MVYLQNAEGGTGYYYADKPPSIIISDPVRYEDSLLARNRTAFAISSGFPGRFKGVASINASKSFPVLAGSSEILPISVGTTPGDIALTRITRGAKWTAKLRSRDRPAALVAAYTGCVGAGRP